MNANCPKCQQQTFFEPIDKKQYQCKKCNSTMQKCRTEDCINMISFGLYCSKCVGRGFKKAGAAAATTGLVLVGVAVKGLLGGKGKS